MERDNVWRNDDVRLKSNLTVRFASSPKAAVVMFLRDGAPAVLVSPRKGENHFRFFGRVSARLGLTPAKLDEVLE